MAEQIKGRDARQGRSRLNVFYILIGGLALSVASFVVLEAIWL